MIDGAVSSEFKNEISSQEKDFREYHESRRAYSRRFELTISQSYSMPLIKQASYQRQQQTGKSSLYLWRSQCILIEFVSIGDRQCAGVSRILDTMDLYK